MADSVTSPKNERKKKKPKAGSKRLSETSAFKTLKKFSISSLMTTPHHIQISQFGKSYCKALESNF